MKNLKGFTLLEITIVLLIVALLLGGILGPLSTRVSQKQIQQEREKLEDIKEALIGYAIVNGSLPCPDTDGDGQAEPSCVPAGTETSIQGGIPFLSLGTSEFDYWGRNYLYAVTHIFTQESLPNTACVPELDGGTTFGLCTLGTIVVNRRVPADRSTSPVINDAPAVIISFGSNGAGRIDLHGQTMAAPVGTDELDNLSGDSVFVTRDYNTKKAPNDCDDTNSASDFCDYDDQLIWISPNILKNRMVQAGRLP